MTLAMVVDAADDHCRVRILGGSEVRTAGYSEPFRPRADSIGPGRLVAIDVTTEPPPPAIGDTVTATTGLADGWRVDATATEPERATGGRSGQRSTVLSWSADML